MKWTYDPQADAIYLTLKKADDIISVGISSKVILDLAADGTEVVGIEIIGADLAYPRLRRTLADEPEILGG